PTIRRWPGLEAHHDDLVDHADHARNPAHDLRRDGALLVLPDPTRQRHVAVLACHSEAVRFHVRMPHASGARALSEAQVHDLPAAGLDGLEALVPQGLAN